MNANPSTVTERVVNAHPPNEPKSLLPIQLDPIHRADSAGEELPASFTRSSVLLN